MLTDQYLALAPTSDWTVFEIADGVAEGKLIFSELRSALAGALAMLADDAYERNHVFYPLLFTAGDVFAFFERVGTAQEDSVLGGMILTPARTSDTGIVIMRPNGDVREFIAAGCRELPMDSRVAGSHDHGRDDGLGGSFHGWTPDVGGSILLSLLRCYADGQTDVGIEFNALTQAGRFANVAYRASPNSPCSTYDHVIEIAESTL